jgi:ornithine carbamoyltransferase
MKDLLRTADLSRADIELLLNTAADFAANPLRSNTALANKSVAIYIRSPLGWNSNFYSWRRTAIGSW